MFKRYVPFLLAIVFFTPVVLSVDWLKTWSYLKTTNTALCFAALGFFLVMIYIKGIRWSYLIKMQGHHYSVWNCFLVYMSTLAMGNVTPGRAGDFAKILYLNKDLKFSTGTSMANTLVDRVFDLYLLLILGCVGILAYPMPIDPNLKKAVWAFFVILILVTLLAFNKKIGETLLKAIFQRMMKQEHKEKVDKLFNDFHKGMECFYKPAILYPAFLSLMAYISFFYGCHLIAVAMGLEVNILYLSFTVAVVNIVSLVSFLGVGTRDGAFIILFKLVGIETYQAEAFSMLFLVIGLVGFSLVGLGCFYLKPIELSFLSKSKSIAGQSSIPVIRPKVQKTKSAKKSPKK